MKKWTWTLILVGIVVLLFIWSIREHFDTYEDALKDVGQTVGYTDPTKPKKSETTKSKADAAKAAEDEASAALKAFQALPPVGSQAESVERDKELNKVRDLQEKARKLSEEADKERASEMEKEGTSKRARCSNEVATKEWDKVSAECKAFMANTPGDPSSRPAGGSSQVPIPNPGGSGLPSGFHKGNIWGPAYTGLGDNAGDGLGSGARDYPTLLGPEPKESVMIEGAGIAQPSIRKKLAKKGALPSSGAMGSNEESKFFGASRLPGGAGGPAGAGGAGAGAGAGAGGADGGEDGTEGVESTVPGDQDLYPGYFGGAGSTAYTSSTGSSKTEPVPFLADFSAFLR
jgi:hypothetical protein